MPTFSANSLTHYATLHPDLKRICDEAIKVTDFAIICGHRGKEAQEQAFRDKKSRVRWPHSRHNSLPSQAMDLTPWPCDWTDFERFFYLAGVILTIASNLGIKLTWLGKTPMRDLPHFELS